MNRITSVVTIIARNSIVLLGTVVAHGCQFEFLFIFLRVTYARYFSLLPTSVKWPSIATTLQSNGSWKTIYQTVHFCHENNVTILFIFHTITFGNHFKRKKNKSENRLQCPFGTKRSTILRGPTMADDMKINTFILIEWNCKANIFFAVVWAASVRDLSKWSA